MASDDRLGDKPQRAGGAAPAGAKTIPDWAGGLKQLYDSVVEEPLPDSFKDLLDRLDEGALPLPDGDDAPGGASGTAR